MYVPRCNSKYHVVHEQGVETMGEGPSVAGLGSAITMWRIKLEKPKITILGRLHIYVVFSFADATFVVRCRCYGILQ